MTESIDAKVARVMNSAEEWAMALRYYIDGYGSQLNAEQARQQFEAALRVELAAVQGEPKTFVQERAQLEQEWCELRKLQAAYTTPQPATEKLASYMARNYPLANGESLTERVIDALETMDIALGMKSFTQPATSAKPADPRKPCGGCGESNPDKRCVGCAHVFWPVAEGDAKDAEIQELLDDADEWARYVEVDTAPMQLRAYLERAIKQRAAIASQKGGQS